MTQVIRGLKTIEIRRNLIAKENDPKFDDALKCAIEHEATVHNTESFSHHNPHVDAVLRNATQAISLLWIQPYTQKMPCIWSEMQQVPSHDCHVMHHFAKMCQKEAKSEQKPIAQQEQKQEEAVSNNEFNASQWP